jgi:HSP20 family protein
MKFMLIRSLYPVRDRALQNRVSSFFEDFAGENTPASGKFVPAVDIYDDGEKVVLTLEIPGVKEEDVDIRVENQTLSVRGERKFEVEDKKEHYQRVERHFGSFYRSFTLPTSVDTDTIAATYNAGVLKVELKKKASAQPRQIKIGVAA